MLAQLLKRHASRSKGNTIQLRLAHQTHNRVKLAGRVIEFRYSISEMEFRTLNFRAMRGCLCVRKALNKQIRI